VRSFLRYALRAWSTPPRYVVLVGDASIDYRDIYELGENLVPTMMVNTPNGLYPSDVWLANTDLSGPAPEVAIGRLPVSSATELEAAITKIKTREAAQGEPWLQRMLLVADGPDAAGDFPADSETIAAIASTSMQVERLYLPLLGASETRRLLLEGLNDGVGMVSYVGHAGYDVLADEGLLWSDDVEQLGNLERPTVLTAMTCSVNDFAQLGYPGLGELLVRKSSGGAVATFGPSGLSENSYAMILAQAYYQAALAGGPVRIGDATYAAMKSYEAIGGPSYMLAIYALLGDPALRLR
jgi:hypothetical protein